MVGAVAAAAAVDRLPNGLSVCVCGCVYSGSLAIDHDGTPDFAYPVCSQTLLNKYVLYSSAPLLFTNYIGIISTGGYLQT